MKMGLEQERKREQFERWRRLKRRRRKQRRRRILIGLGAFVIFLVVGIFFIFFNPFASRPDPSKIVMPDWIEEALLPENPYSRPGTPLTRINGIVVHYVGNPGTTAWQNNSYFAGLANQPEEGGTYASSHFLIDLDGTIIQNVPISEIAYCSNNRNDDTISIECCHPDESGEFTPETYESLVRLTSWLSGELKLKGRDIIRHYDVNGKVCPKYFVDYEDAWLQFKEDVKNRE